ncbi:DUF3307 domain-containing protein [Reichenbachiella sp. MSK19-1]|uniref:DUF3307 domain-containing protein n=1 Tax=Reichenbachiella sp. MSK19-1 TaxID=1897631 RepID=UPI000E6B6A0E|nr:DUF3307 domain-containing protein [Reichenbachiella sp. MSK19-1]RJE74765.1 hypothetical protein BGP76_16670 [Reichenbachiella sp. MSK19-1]
MIVFALQLLIAHVIGDFVCQPNAWVLDKIAKGHKSRYLYIHLAVHIVALAVLLQMDYWPVLLIIGGSHGLIDVAKLRLMNHVNHLWLFVWDQLAHLTVIAATVLAYYPVQINWTEVYSTHLLLLVLALLMLTSVVSVVMKQVMSRWSLDEDDATDSLAEAGKYIGILERLFVFGFIILDQWQAIGLLIAAKSVFRFSDLSRAKDRKLTEYILIGTLLSFGLSIVIGLAYQYAGAYWMK